MRILDLPDDLYIKIYKYVFDDCLKEIIMMYGMRHCLSPRKYICYKQYYDHTMILNGNRRL